MQTFFPFKIGAGGTLTIILALAKIFGHFPYSWWWVAAPLLIAYIVSFALVITAIFTAAAVGYDDES